MTGTEAPVAEGDVVAPRSRRWLPQLGDAWWSVAGWVLGGVALGLAVARLMYLTPGATVVTVLLVTAGAVLARGLGELLLACAAVLGLVSLVVAFTSTLSLERPLSFGVIAPLALVALLAGLALARWRGVRFPTPAPWGQAVVDVLAGSAALAWAATFGSRLAEVPASQTLRFLVQAEDNAAWVNLVSAMDRSGATVVDNGSLEGVGPVLTTYMGLVRHTFVSYGDPARIVDVSAQVTMLAQGLLVLAAPLVAAFLARRTRGLRSSLRALAIWFTATILVAAPMVVFSATFGFLSASLAHVLLLMSAAAVTLVRVRRPTWVWSTLVWVPVLLACYAAAGAWVPLAPLGAATAVGLFALAVAGAGRWVLDQRRLHGWQQPSLAVLGPLVLMVNAALAVCLALAHQFLLVIDPVGGGAGLLGAVGSTPIAAMSVLAVTLVLVSLGWLVRPQARAAAFPGLQRPLVVLMAYVVAVTILEAWQTEDGSHYGTKKLLFVMVGVWLVLALVELVTSTQVGGRGLEATLAICLSCLVVLTVQDQPVFQALQSRWPKAQDAPVWLDPVQRLTADGNEVYCLNTSSPAPDIGAESMLGYLCTRWAVSVGGDDGPGTLPWRSMLLGLAPVQAAVDAVKARPADAPPLKVLVLGDPTKLDDPGAWWAPIRDVPGLEFVSP